MGKKELKQPSYIAQTLHWDEIFRIYRLFWHKTFCFQYTILVGDKVWIFMYVTYMLSNSLKYK